MSGMAYDGSQDGQEKSLGVVLADAEVDAAVLRHRLLGSDFGVLDELAVLPEVLLGQITEKSEQVNHLN